MEEEDGVDGGVGAEESGYDRDETRNLVNDYFKYRLTAKGFEWTPPPMVHLHHLHHRPHHLHHDTNKVMETMRTLGDEFESRYSQSFDEMCHQLHITLTSAYPTFMGVTNELFSEGIQWGRVVALFAFGGSLAAQCMHKELPQLVDSIAEWVAEYIDQHLAEWIANHGGWQGFVEYYDVDVHPERRNETHWPTLRNFFCGVAAGALGVLTIGAILTSRS